jgi:hypothetical protein
LFLVGCRGRNSQILFCEGPSGCEKDDTESNERLSQRFHILLTRTGQA